MSALQRTSSTHAANLQDLARQAQSQGKATIVTMNGKQYAIINITRDGFGEVPSGEKAQKLAQQIIGAHQTQPPSLAGKEITHIDSKGAHYKDGTFTSHTQVNIDQKTFHTNTQGLPDTPQYPEDLEEPSNEQNQLTNPQIAIQRTFTVVSQFSDTDTITVENLKDIMGYEGQDLPEEFRNEFSTLIHGKQDSDKISKQDLADAFTKAYWGDDKKSGYIGRLQKEHLAGTKQDTHQTFNTAFEALFKQSKPFDLELYNLNALTASHKTAQHAWNALESLVPKTDGVAGKILFIPIDDDPLQVPVGSNPPPPLSSLPVETREQLQAQAVAKGLLKEISLDEIEKLPADLLKLMLAEEEFACILGVKQEGEQLSLKEIMEKYPARRQTLEEEAKDYGIENPHLLPIDKLFLQVEAAKQPSSSLQPVLSERSEKLKGALIALADLKGLFGAKTPQQIAKHSIQYLRKMIAYEQFACVMQLKAPEKKLSFGEITDLILLNKKPIIEALKVQGIAVSEDPEWDDLIREVLVKAEKDYLYGGRLA